MRICERALEFIQIINEDGDVRNCSWQYDGGIIGRLTENSMEEIYNGPAARLIRERHICGDFLNCNPNACPYVANDTVREHEVEIDEIPRVPQALWLAYENVCNYQCVMCTIPDCMEKSKNEEREKKLDILDAEVRKVLPYVKKLSANGQGEVFACKHIMQILSEWNPMADPSECYAEIETNGSLFNEKNWKKIENLGKYHLTVYVTVLSFEEDVYQELSGTKLPIQNLIDNLHFVKKLREQGIINNLVIATVYQDKNFRTLPEFAKRAIEEFGADYVRLRPFEPWREATMEEWMRDVRNEYHPHHAEFLEVMKDPIMQHPKVHDWGGGKVSGLGPEPYPRTRMRYGMMDAMFCNSGFMDRLKTAVGDRDVVIYGMIAVGRALTTLLKDKFNVIYCIDRAMHGQTYEGIPIYSVDRLNELSRNATVLVTLDQNEKPVIEALKKMGFAHCVSVKDFM